MKKSTATKVVVKGEVNDDGAWWWLIHKGISAPFICVTLFAILVRVAVSLHPYSGAGDPPKYGDFEAQRHWMEITTNLPVNEWYHNSTNNDLSYWGLDYPPFTAYQSYVHGLVLRFFHPESVSLHTSRGHESYIGKLLMRWTVITSDVFIFFPAALWFIIVYADQLRHNKSNLAWHIAMILLNPCLILIDHGHFQYNCISLGLSVGAVAAVLCGKDLVASFLFSLALNHKQMSAYYAPAFFSHLLGKSLRRQNPLLEVSKLGMVVIGTFALVWWPYLHSRVAVFEVLSRLAPFERGIYEDYVANFWCTTSVLVKWKRLFTTESLKLLSLNMTVLSFLPSMFLQIRAPSNRTFLYALLNSAFSFYFYSFQAVAATQQLTQATLISAEETFKFHTTCPKNTWNISEEIMKISDHYQGSIQRLYSLKKMPEHYTDIINSEQINHQSGWKNQTHGVPWPKTLKQQQQKKQSRPYETYRPSYNARPKFVLASPQETITGETIEKMSKQQGPGNQIRNPQWLVDHANTTGRKEP